jgi:cell division septation protein DedD
VSAPRRGQAGRSRVGALLGLALLAVPGFLLGGLAGVVWQDPGLVARYLLGRTQQVDWGPGAGSEVAASAATPPDAAEEAGEPALPAVAAAPEPRPAAPAEPHPAAAKPLEHAAAPAAGRAAASKPPPPAGQGRVAVQVGAFGEELAAERLAGSLRAKGYPAYVVSGGTGAASWRVRVGPWPSRAAGEQAAARLKREERLPTWVLEEDR